MQNTKERVRVLLVGPALCDPGGVARYYEALLPWLRADRHIAVRYLEIGPSRSADREDVRERLRAEILSHRHDVVHLNPSFRRHSFERGGLLARAAKNLGTAVVVTFHGWDSAFESSMGRHLMPFAHQTYARADVLIVLGMRLRAQVEAWGLGRPVLVGRPAVSVDLAERFSLARRLKRAQTVVRPRILFLSRLERAKGVLETIEAFEVLLKTGRAARLSIAGTGRMGDEVARRVRELPRGSQWTKLLGYVTGPAKANVLQTHDVYCVPTRYGEGFPVSLAEAMMFGLAIVTRRAGGIADLFEPGRMGQLVTQGGPRVIATQLERVLMPPPDLVEIARYNHAFASAHFSAPLIARQLATVYRSLAPGGPRADDTLLKRIWCNG